MSDFTPSLLTAMIQITLVGLPAVAVVWSISRRCAAASATLALAGLTVAAILSAAAFVPLPNAWTWSRNTESIVARADSAPANGAASPAVPVVDLGQLFALLRTNESANETSGWTWSAAISLGILAIMGLSIARIFVGWIAIRNLRRRSERISDPAIRAIGEELARDLGVRRRVKLRSSPAVGSAATLGWRHPAILLASDWPAWSLADLRAVLAHELAHIRRRDYVRGIVGRICLAISFHHPLAIWLSSRLRLAQEIAADELAAIVAGGRECYRKALVRMALRQDSAWLGGLAPTFGTNRLSLTRRLTMLAQESNRSIGRATRSGLIGLIVAIGVVISALRGSAEPPAAEAPASSLPPFELGYLPEKVNAFIAIRPGALLGRSDMKPVLDVATAALDSMFTTLGFPANAISLEEIEQVIGPIELKRLSEEERKKMPGGERNSISMGIALIRLKRDYDWPALLRAMPKWMSVTEKGGGVFEIRSAMVGPQPMTLRVLDPRTIVGTDASDAVAADRRADISKRFGAKILAEANRAGLAIAVDNSSAKWTDALKERPESLAAVDILNNPTRLAFCLNWTDTVTGSILGDWATTPTQVAEGRDKICRMISEAIKTAKPSDAADQRLLEVISEMLRSVKVREEGTMVKVDFASSLRWADLTNVFLHRSSAAVEVKESQSKED